MYLVLLIDGDSNRYTRVSYNILMSKSRVNLIREFKSNYSTVK